MIHARALTHKAREVRWHLILSLAHADFYPGKTGALSIVRLATRSVRIHHVQPGRIYISSLHNAGQNLPYCHQEGMATELRATGMPLGLMPAMSYEEKEITLNSGASVLLYTDGLIEAHNPQREMFGTPRMERFVGAHPGGAALIDSLLAELEQFTGDEWEQEDDITLLTLQRFRS
jgi:serine phosphatase RsbU (regulator of sigma subunit)